MEDHSGHPGIVKAAANAVASLCRSNSGNQAAAGDLGLLGLLQVLMRRMSWRGDVQAALGQAVASICRGGCSNTAEASGLGLLSELKAARKGHPCHAGTLMAACECATVIFQNGIASSCAQEPCLIGELQSALRGLPDNAEVQQIGCNAV